MQSGCAATLHHLIVALHVGGDEDDLGAKPRPCVSKKLHGVWPSSSFLRVPEDHSLGFDMLSNQTRNRGSECLLLIRAYPNEKPVWTLDAGGQCCADTGSSADTDSSLEHGRGMSDASCDELVGRDHGKKACEKGREEKGVKERRDNKKRAGKKAYRTSALLSIVSWEDWRQDPL